MISSPKSLKMPNPEGKQLLAIDIDDVLADSTDALRLFVNQKCGVDLTEQQYKIEAQYWGYYEKVWEQHGLNTENLLREFHTGMVKDQSDIREIPGSVDGVSSLSESYRLLPITSRPEDMRGETLEWLNEKFDSVFISEPVFLGFGPTAYKTKGQVCHEIGAFYLIDDNVEHCKTAIAYNIGTILFGNYGWHQEIPDGLIRCRTWNNVTEYFSDKS
jgi:5'(3')-deoxyribonucleotidase